MDCKNQFWIEYPLTTWNNLEPSWSILNLQHLRPWSHILWPQCGAGCQWCSTSQNTQPAWAGCVASVPHGKKHPISWWITKVESDILQHPATSSPDLLAFPAHGLLALQAVHKGLNPCIQALASLCSCQHILTERSLHPNKLTCRQLLKACHTLLAANLLKFFPLQDWPNAAITCN